MRLLTIDPCEDPGSGKMGIARFVDKELVYCGNTLDGHAADVVLVELPEVYLQSPGDPNILIRMAFTAGMVAANVPCVTISTVLPKEWKGQVPKEVHNNRTMATLTKREVGVFSACAVKPALRHNVLDAIGLGLWYLKRFYKEGVL